MPLNSVEFNVSIHATPRIPGYLTTGKTGYHRQKVSFFDATRILPRILLGRLPQ